MPVVLTPSTTPPSLQLFEIIKRGEYYFHEDAWGEISESARDLVARMLTLDTRERITTDGVRRPPEAGLPACSDRPET